MGTFVGLLRAINVGKRRVKMDALQTIVEASGFENVSTLLASGNLVFQSRMRATVRIESTLEDQFLQNLNFSVETFVRQVTELDEIAQRWPFDIELQHSSEHTLHLGFFKEPLPKRLTRALLDCQTDDDQLWMGDREIYWLRHGRLSESELWDSAPVRALKLPVHTFRNVATIQKLVKLAKVTTR